ncbi:dihydropteroate synthase [Enterobacter cloacae]
MNKSLIIFGIVNITSDSFSDGGRYLAPDAAIAQARKLMAEGADVIDLGPASSNPDAAPVSSDTEIARIAPVLDALKADGIPVSLDSYQPATQAYALSRGVAYLNDIRGFPDAAFYPQLAKSSAKLVVMHSVQDGQADRREAPAGDIMDHIAAFFDARIAALTGAGIKRNRLVLDPGMGFFWGLLPKPRSRCWRGSMNCGCASICRCFCLFRANPFCARAHRPWSGDVGAATLAAELAAAAGGADFIRTHEPRPLRDGLAVLAALKETAKNSLTAHSGYFSIFALHQKTEGTSIESN